MNSWLIYLGYICITNINQIRSSLYFTYFVFKIGNVFFLSVSFFSWNDPSYRSSRTRKTSFFCCCCTSIHYSELTFKKSEHRTEYLRREYYCKHKYWPFCILLQHDILCSYHFLFGCLLAYTFWCA